MKLTSTHFFIVLIVLVIAGLVYVRSQSDTQSTSTKFDSFAQCLGDAGAKFYGAFWCPHCQEQKAMLENTTKLPYVECSTPDGQNQTQVCIDEQITSYPTWKMGNGEVLAGVQQLQTLAEKTSCELPQS